MGPGSLGKWIGRSQTKIGKRLNRVADAIKTFGKVSLFLALGLSVGCGGGSGSSSQVTVAVSPTTASLALDGVQQFTATVTNDSTNRGVTWSLTQNGTSCAPVCGTVYPTITPSGSPTVYTAPAVTPPFSPGVTLTATAVVNSTATASVAIVVAGTIGVSVSPATTTVALGQTATFIGNALNDTTTDGVTWGLSQNGVACSPGCGTISPGQATFSCGTTTPPPGGFCTASGGEATYTAPSTAPTNDTVKLTVTDIAAPGESGWSIITIQGGVSLSISPTYANVPVKGTQKFTATVTNDTSNKGVTWKLSQSGSSCSASACGTLSTTTSLSGTAITYTAPSSAATVTLTATSVADSSQSTYATIVVQPISVTISPTIVSPVYANNLENFIATVSNDVAEKGVTWTLTVNGKGCSPGCGTISPTSTAGGVQTTYTAPSSISSATTVTLTATSVSDTSKSASATLSLYPPATVSISPSSATAKLGSKTQFTATVTNDPTAAGVAWAVEQSGKDCSPACGSVSPTTTTGDISSTFYTAPASMPSSSTVKLVATSEAELSQQGTATITLSNSTPVTTLTGNYTFLTSGYNSAGTVVMAGSITTDAAGNVTGGLADINSSSGVTTAVPLTGTYTAGSDNTGTLTLTSASLGTTLASFQFALNSSGDQASLVESGNGGTRAWGTLNKQSGAHSAASVKGNYAFSASGTDPDGSRFVLAGRFHADGNGRISAGVMDSDDGGSVTTGLPFTGSYSVSSAGRGTLTTDTPDGPMHWAFYMVSPGNLVLVSTDPEFSSPVNGGEAKAQTAGTVPSGFTNASLRGTSVISLAGTAGGGLGAKVEAGLVTFDGAGGLRYSIDRNDGGATGTLTGTGTYSVEPDGRVTIWLSSNSQPLVVYLQAPNQGVVVGTGAGASMGALDAQAPGPFSDAAFSGDYVVGTWAAPAKSAALQAGLVKSTGMGSLVGMGPKTAFGNISAPAESFPNVYFVAPSGRVAIGGGGSVLYLISPSKGILLNMKPGDTAGTISRVEK